MLTGVGLTRARVRVAQLQRIPDRYYVHLLILGVATVVAVSGSLQRSVNIAAVIPSPASDLVVPEGWPDATGDASRRAVLIPPPTSIGPNDPVQIPPAPAAFQPRARTEIVTYLVREGDTVRGIGERFGISTDTIRWANDLDDPDQIVVGQELRILPVSGILHRVREGDTLVSIAERYSTEASAVAEYNKFANADLLVVGQTFLVPGGRMPDPPSVTIPTYEHVVEAGETLAAIAEWFGVPARSIIAWNGLRDADLIRPGQTIVIPGVSGPPPAPAQPGPTPAPASSGESAAGPEPVPAPAPSRATAARSAPAAPVEAPVPLPVPRSPLELDIANYALQFVGYPYVWGATGPRAFDCSGFAWYVMKQKGINIPRDLWGMLQAGRPVSQDQLRPGDLVFYVNTYQPGLSHVGVYVGNGQFVNAQSERTGVVVATMSNPYWATRYYAARRYGS